ncbi:MAG: hypothetical protein IKS31_12440 [Clostridia bacterium]|nr:hypothetical protein [Clostridia bacterium]
MRLRRITAAILALAAMIALLPAPAETPDAAACGLRGWSESLGYQYVALGTYPWYEDGTRAPVLWRVLDVDEESGKALLLTEYLIGVCQPIYCDDPKVAERKKYRRIDDYGESDMNVWLNDTMLPDIFTGDPLIAAVTEERYGRLYPLTDKELMTEKYGFSKSRYWVQTTRQAYASPYCLSVKLHPNYGSKVYKDPSTGTSSYWAAALKAPGSEFMQICGLDGHLSYGRLARTTVGLRVALHLDVTKIQVYAGAGTLEDPCFLAYVHDGVAETAPRGEDPVPHLTPKPKKTNKKKTPTPAPAATPVPTPGWLPDALRTPAP